MHLFIRQKNWSNLECGCECAALALFAKKSMKYRCVWLFDPQFGDHEIHHLLGNIVHKAAI